MSVLLEHFPIPNQGLVQLNLNWSFTINVTADVAQKQVNNWLLDEVSCNIGAGEPDLAISEHSTVWRVPAILTAPHIGYVGIAGTVDVNVQTGKMSSLEEYKAQILAGARKLVEKMPPYERREKISQEFIAKDMKPTRTKPQGDPLEIIASFDSP